MRRMTNFLTGLKEAWVLARPYFYSEERWGARGLLATIIALNLLMVALNVVITYWNRNFFNAIQAYDATTCIRLIYLYVPTPGGHFPMPGIIELFTVYIVVAVYALYLNQMLQIRWRQWMTRHTVADWLADRAFYNLSLRAGGAVVDNPDQRIAEDLRDFTTSSLSLGLDFISNVVTLFSFIFVLYVISGSIKLFGFTIPGYMVWVALIYAVIGTFFTQIIGRKLVPLSFNQQRVEANFRFNLVRVRENPEAIALYGGEADEQAQLASGFQAVRDNFWAIMRRTKLLNFFVVGFNQIAGIFPLLVTLPRYFAHQVALGGMTQIQNVFPQVQGAFSWFVTSYQDLVTWRATVSRLYGFREALIAARAASHAGPQLAAKGEDLALAGLTLSLPDGRVLLDDATLSLPPGQPITVAGPSGAGKSTLFRALAGIWPYGKGSVTRPAGNALFLPQKPYFPLGSLKHAVAYPRADATVSDAAAAAALQAVELGFLAPRLGDTENWGQLLSGGEQQRLALARAVVAKPDWLFLDEALSAMDAAMAGRLTAMLRRELPRTTVVSITHDESHAQGARLLTLTPGALSTAMA